MTINYPYYLKADNELVFTEIRFLDISPKTKGLGAEATQQTTTEGIPKWTVSALVKVGEEPQQTENFTLVASQSTAEQINKIPTLTPIRLLGFEMGKWTKKDTDKTYWSFQMTGVEAVK